MDIEKAAKWVGLVISVATALWGIFSAVQARRNEARRPYLNLQLTLYQEATKTVSVLATSSDQAELARAEERFWQLYYGELAMVENGGSNAEDGGVESAMVQVGQALQARPVDKALLQTRSLALAHVCRNSLAESWDVKNWKAPVYRQADSQ